MRKEELQLAHQRIPGVQQSNSDFKLETVCQLRVGGFCWGCYYLVVMSLVALLERVVLRHHQCVAGRADGDDVMDAVVCFTGLQLKLPVVDTAGICVFSCVCVYRNISCLHARCLCEIVPASLQCPFPSCILSFTPHRGSGNGRRGRLLQTIKKFVACD